MKPRSSPLDELMNTSTTIQITLPIEVFSTFKTTPAEFWREIRLAGAVKWYEMGVVSQEKAAAIADLCREDFLLALARFRVSPFQYSADEVLQEAGYGNLGA